MKKIVFSILTATLFCLAISTTAFSQSNQGAMNHVIYFQVEDLTVENYQSLIQQLKHQNEFVIKEVCVPAGVMSLKWSEPVISPEKLAQFKSIAAQSDLKTIVVLPNYDDEKFVQKCSASRSVN